MSNYDEWWKTMADREETARIEGVVLGHHFMLTGDEALRASAEKLLKLADTLREERYTAERVHRDRLWVDWLRSLENATKMEDGR